MPLVINSLGGGHTHTHKHILIICTGSILRNQARAWFKKLFCYTLSNDITVTDITKVMHIAITFQ